MESCYAAAEEAINKQAGRALAALAPPHWTPSVIGTAAAIVAGAAKPLCAQHIIAQVSCIGAAWAAAMWYCVVIAMSANVLSNRSPSGKCAL